VDFDADSSDEWTPSAKAGKDTSSSSSCCSAGKQKGVKPYAGSTDKATTGKATKTPEGKKNTPKGGKAGAGRKGGGVGGGGGADSGGDDGDGGSAGGAADGFSSADDEATLKWAVDDQEGVDLRKSVLHRVKWTRIILDEAHKIKVRCCAREGLRCAAPRRFACMRRSGVDCATPL
jgi:hypothetical protein